MATKKKFATKTILEQLAEELDVEDAKAFIKELKQKLPFEVTGPMEGCAICGIAAYPEKLAQEHNASQAHRAKVFENAPRWMKDEKYPQYEKERK